MIGRRKENPTKKCAETQGGTRKSGRRGKLVAVTAAEATKPILMDAVLITREESRRLGRPRGKEHTGQILLTPQASS